MPLADLPEAIRSAVQALDSIAEPREPDDTDLVWLQDPNVDKYTFAGRVSIDCDSRLHLCRAACCSMSFPLSLQDLDEGVVAWDPGRPYAIAHGADDNCVHLDSGCQCTIYQQRPLPCRVYDCRNDERIWLDFDERVPNPALHADRTAALPSKALGL